MRDKPWSGNLTHIPTWPPKQCLARKRNEAWKPGRPDGLWSGWRTSQLRSSTALASRASPDDRTARPGFRGVGRRRFTIGQERPSRSSQAPRRLGSSHVRARLDWRRAAGPRAPGSGRAGHKGRRRCSRQNSCAAAQGKDCLARSRDPKLQDRARRSDLAQADRESPSRTS